MEGETVGDGSSIACPWCGAKMDMADDARWECDWDNCEHCKKRFKLRHSVDITTWASRVEEKES